MNESNRDVGERPVAGDDARALRHMVDELRAEKAPELDWDAMERNIFAAIDPPAAVIPVSRVPSAFARVATFAVAAAVLALGIGLGASTRPPRHDESAAVRRIDPAAVARAPGEAGARGAHDLEALAVGDSVEAGAEPVAFGRDGAVRWTLSPGGRAVVRSVGDHGVGQVVALESGSLRAEVTPHPAAALVETFAVEVAGTRVAVHGTAFTVTRLERGLVVDVEHGAVAVGPVGHDGTTTGHLLVGPSRAAFSLDGGRWSRLLPRTDAEIAIVESGAEEAARVAPPRPGELAPALPASRAVHAAPLVAARDATPAHDAAQAPSETPSPSAPAAGAVEPPAPIAAIAPAPEPVFLTKDAVRAQISQCFNSAYGAGSGAVQVSMTSTLHLVIDKDGKATAARFSQPLEPAFQKCATSIVWAGRFASGPQTIDLPIHFGP